MSLLSRLFGARSEPKIEPEIYKDFSIFPEPLKEGSGYRVAARIEKRGAGADQVHHLVRADVCSDLDEARRLSVAKSKQMTDQQGDAIFD